MFAEEKAVVVALAVTAEASAVTLAVPRPATAIANVIATFHVHLSVIFSDSFDVM